MSKKNLILCFEDKIELFNPLGRPMRVIDLQDPLKDCFFNMESYVGLYLVFESYRTKNLLQNSLKEVSRTGEGMGNYQTIFEFKVAKSGAKLKIQKSPGEEEEIDFGSEIKDFRILRGDDQKFFFIWLLTEGKS